MKRLIPAVIILLALVANFAVAGEDTDFEKRIKELEKRLRKVEVKSAVDRVNFTGDFRFEAHNIQAEMPDYVDGLAMQSALIQNVWMANNAVMDFSDPVDQLLFQSYAQTLSWDQLQADIGAFMMANGYTMDDLMAMMAGMAPAFMREGYDVDNDILYTSRLRLNMRSKVADNISFDGRLSMFKPWGDSSGIQVFNGQANSLNIDGNTTRTPNSDILRVDRAYFSWREMFDTSLYLSIGRRPSTGGPPMHLRDDELRAGTPLGTVIDFQFDGITAGVSLNDYSKVRLCYGLGYESGFGSAENLKTPADRLKDTHFLGLNWDVYDKDDTYVQATFARAFDVTDGFNGLVVLPDNPVTGMANPGPMVMRFTPSTNLGDIDLAGLLVMREAGPFDLFASFNYMKSHPEMATTPFGGLFSDPFGVPQEQDATMFYAGARYSFDDQKTKLGLEFNHGSEYWFSFSQGADDIIAPKTATRGDVWEIYLTHRVTKRFIAKLDFMKYDYDYSGSGWHLGAPKDLDSSPMLGYPTYDSATKLALSMTARF